MRVKVIYTAVLTNSSGVNRNTLTQRNQKNHNQNPKVFSHRMICARFLWLERGKV